MKIRLAVLIPVCAFLAGCQPPRPPDPVTFGGLLDEMTDLGRLTRLPDPSYRTIQFSSYDRRSVKPGEAGWFANEDGFGGEPIPGFEKVLKEPGADGTGEYLICDEEGPGAVVRFWTAGITGRVRFFLDQLEKPFFEGPAEDLFWRLPGLLTGDTAANRLFRQFDAVYFPIPFSKRCRLEWIGKISELHFYHVGIRMYSPGTTVVTPDPLPRDFRLPAALIESGITPAVIDKQSMDAGEKVESDLSPETGREIWSHHGSGAIDRLAIRLAGSDTEAILRKCILRIYFDHADIPQVEAPVGDFFGSAPGLNPCRSLPFSIEADGTMECRFVMPFRKGVRLEVISHATETVHLSGLVHLTGYKWEEGRSMHFRARWRIDHGLTASDTLVRDLTYLNAAGTGRLVGAATCLYNPSQVPTSWGNWWGEGDEKIRIDRESFPSFFGTGSEDYYNYSWSSALLFSHPYCGQPRNDGPGNRGYVSNFRWHILDDIPFNNQIDFCMELRSHGPVPGFSYGRIAYYYALPKTTDDYKPIGTDDVRELPYDLWYPEGYAGSAGYRFILAEELAASDGWTLESGRLWAGGRIVWWKPKWQGDRLRFRLNCPHAMDNASLGFTMARLPGGATIELVVNGLPARLNGQNRISLTNKHLITLDNFFAAKLALKKGANEIELVSRDTLPGCTAGIDFIWIRE